MNYYSNAQNIALDSNYVKKTIRLAQASENEEEVFEQMENALLVARSLNYKDGKKYVVKWLASYHQEKGDNIAALRYQLELLEGIDEDAYEQQKETLLEIAQIYQEEKLYDKAIEYYRQALPFLSDRTQVWEQMGDAFLAQQEVDSALYYFVNLEGVTRKKQDETTLLRVLQKQGQALQNVNRWELVLEKDQEILKRVEGKKPSNLLARCYNNLGYDYSQLKDYENAILYLKKANEANTLHLSLNTTTLNTNLGIAYQNIGDLNTAIQYFQKARAPLVRAKNGEQFARLSHLMANVYYKNEDFYNALIFNEEALNIARTNGAKKVLSESYNTGALIYQNLYDYEKSLDYYKKHLALRDSFLLEERIKQQSLLQQQYLLERAEKEIKILISNQEIKDLSINQLNLEKEKLELASKGLQLEAEKQESELFLLRKEQEIQDASLKNKELEALQAQQNFRLTAQKLETEKQEREISELNRKEAEQRLALAQKDAEEKERLKEISILNKDKELLTQEQEITQLELEKQSAFRRLVYGLGGLTALILGLILLGLFFSRRANRKLAQQKLEIEKNRDLIQEEKSKSDALLLNILPSETAEELKETGFATPRKYELVSVLFTDFSGFTAISKNMSAEELIAELNECFLAFDEIIEKYNLEKIKTIGDAYMCAGGIPTPNISNPNDMVRAALEMQAFMQAHIIRKQLRYKKYWNIRIGIHTGAVIAGVVGSKKFVYDIWGDTVNIASRMESNSEEGAINISAATHHYIKNDFDCTYRGVIPIKNGGEVEMYFVNT